MQALFEGQTYPFLPQTDHIGRQKMSSDVLIVLVLALIFFGGGFFLAYKVRKTPQEETRNDSSVETTNGTRLEKEDEPAVPISSRPDGADLHSTQSTGKQRRTSSRRARKSQRH
jgi:hypothetical protein